MSCYLTKCSARPTCALSDPLAKEPVLDACLREAVRQRFFEKRTSKEHDMLNSIETARLILRPWHVDDLEELEQLWASPLFVKDDIRRLNESRPLLRTWMASQTKWSRLSRPSRRAARL